MHRLEEIDAALDDLRREIETGTKRFPSQWAQQWSDVVSFEIYAAVDDAGFAKMLG